MSASDTTLPAASPRRNPILLGIGLMMLGVFGYSLNDAMGKWLVSTYSVAQIMFIRGAFALAVLAPFIWHERIVILRRWQQPGLHLLRAACIMLEVGCFYAAVAYLPLAKVMTFYLAAPIYVTALSPFLLGEHVGWRRWVAVLVGFAGVVVALQPSGAGFGIGEILACVGSLIFGALMILTRKLRDASDTLLITTQVAAPMLGGLVVAPFMWVAPTSVDFGLLGLLGIVSMLASFCVNRALKLAPASVVVPYQYTFIIWAVIFGYMFFDDAPQLSTLVGASIIIGAGLFIFLREQKAGTGGAAGLH
ncbi:DMT family transporter [Xanthobacteraceae bacterium A53D]